MKIGRLIAYIAAAILIFFGVLFVWGAFSAEAQALGQSTGWIVIGVIGIAAGLVLIGIVGWRSRKGAKETVEIVQKLELSGDVSLEQFSCKNCGGTLSSENVKMVAGAPVVECPFCRSSYQLEEAPKW